MTRRAMMGLGALGRRLLVVAAIACSATVVDACTDASAPPPAASAQLPVKATPHSALMDRDAARQMRGTTMAQRLAARLARPVQQVVVNRNFAGVDPATAPYSPLGGGDGPLAEVKALGAPDFFNVGNYANSPLPQLDPATGTVVPGTGMRKFVDSLPGLTAAGANNLGQYIPVAIPDTTTYPGSDYYEISLVEYTERMHSDLPAAGTKLRGYVQTNTTDATVSVPHYLGPVIVAQKDRPVRVKFTNNLPTGAAGNLFIPVDTTYMGAGMGPDGMNMYTQNRATLHLHGGNTPWISDGTPHQWTVPAAEVTPFPKGMVTQNVPDMPDPGPGSMTFYWTNQQSARLLFYHDHAYGITRLNVYAGEAAGYLVQDPVEQTLVTGGTIGTTTVAPGTVPADQIPLVIQDKTFVPDTASGGQLAAQDPTWDVAAYGGMGNLWFPHVYMPNQNPNDPSGSSAYGRWDYGPWFWPPVTTAGGLVHGPITGDGTNGCPMGLVCPGMPNPTGVPESFLDTPVVNGTAYPYVVLQPKAYRLRILNACNDRYLNLQLYYAEPLTLSLTAGGTGYSPAPAVAITGDGTGATATAQVTGVVNAIALGAGGSGYTTAPTVTISGGGGGGATAGAIVSAGAVTGVVITAGGAGYTTAPTVSFSGGGGTGAAATATVTNTVVGLTVTAPGTGYTHATVAITDATGTGATAIASVGTEVKMVPAVPHYAVPPAPCPTMPPELPLCPPGVKTGVAGATTAGIPYGGPGCWPELWPADGRAGGVPDPTTVGPNLIQIGTEGGLLPNAAIIDNQPVGYEYMRRSITVLNVQDKSLYLGPAERADVVVDLSAVPPGSTLILYNDAPAPMPAFDTRIDYYTGDPDQTLAGGAPSTLPGYGPNTRTIMQIRVAGTPAAPFNVAALQAAVPPAFAASQPAPLVPESAFNTALGTTFTDTYSTIFANSLDYVPPGSTAVGSVNLTAGGSGYTSPPTVGFTGGGGTGAAATATITGPVTALTLTNGGRGYRAATTSVTLTGGGGTGATATVAVRDGSITSITLTNGGAGYTSPPTVTIVGEGRNAAATATITGPVTALTLTSGGTGYTSMPAVTFSGGGGAGAAATASFIVHMPMVSKCIQELFELDYGRMNATLGTELPRTSMFIQTTIPLSYIDPATEVMQTGQPQLWKITHNGVDTHAIHFHLMDVQLINRIGWDGMVKPPAPNEVGWKDTIEMNPLEDIVVAVRPSAQTLPFKLGDSVRPLDVTMPVGSTGQFSNVDPYTNTPVVVTNQMMNFGWEYVWHCHLLGHEENDMMRPIIMRVSPAAPSGLAATSVLSTAPPSVTLTWIDNSTTPAATMFGLQRADDANFTVNVVTLPTGASLATSFVDTTVTGGSTYYYRVRAENAVAFSPWSATASVTAAGQLPLPVTGLTVTAFTASSISVAWTNPTGGAPATGLRVEYRNGALSRPWNLAATLPPTATSYTITGLRNNTLYSIRVVAVNAFGGSPSTVISQTTAR
ncbi:MAG: fibronectin type III domain-containing protein [Deltaproteobacteria bacterium]|nr:fibronectin type III domain-containing protein [Deltaproteobacteria bacterium]